MTDGRQMRILWLCNIVLPDIAKKLGIQASNKEGWLSGVSASVKKSHDFELGVCFPVPQEFDGFYETIDGIEYYGFYEDTSHPEVYDSSLEEKAKKIVEAFRPDMVHIFGTEYPHTLAMARAMEDTPERLLIGVQGVMDIYAEHYFDGLPDYVIERVTLRDFLKKDSLKEQKEKFEKRAAYEDISAVITGNITGRTPFDLDFALRKNHEAKYHFLNETLRPEFYEGQWKEEDIEPHSIFLSQGNYPIKGLHYMLKVMPHVIKKYPDAKLYVAGDNVTRHCGVKDVLKLSSYGKYLLELIKKYKLEKNIEFTGSLDAEGIKARLLKSHVFICPSSIENSPNSLGEAMILGVPCIAANVGGVSGIFRDGADGIMFERGDIKGLYQAIDRMFSNPETVRNYTSNASMHAHITHNPEVNYKRLLEIYREITECN